MRACLILNPAAGTAASGGVDLATFRAHVAAHADYALREAREPGEATALAAAAAREGFDLVAACGGDGTVHEVANGLMDAARGGRSDVAFGIIPLGTGNDFARTLALPENPVDALHLLALGERHRLDLIRVTASEGEGAAAEGDGGPRYAVNVCAGGFSGQLDELMTDELKQTWGPLSYLIGAAKALPDLTDYEVEIAWDDGPAERIDAFNVVVANGRTAGGGKPAAPRANPEDGLLDVVVVRECAPADLAALAALVFAGDYLADDRIVFRRVRRLTVAARPGMWFNVDGELLSKEPVTFEVAPGALPVVVGKGYRAVPDPAAPAAMEPDEPI